MSADTAKTVVRLLGEHRMTVSSAESCTGGLAAKLLTDVPGASEVFPGGIVSYANRVKELLVGVRPETLRTDGAVSSTCAYEMAQGIRQVMGTDIGISTTGYAGPGGEDVGLVFIGYADAAGTVCRTLRLTGGRDEIRRQAAQAVLALILEENGWN